MLDALFLFAAGAGGATILLRVLLMIEKLDEVVAKQVEAIQNLKIDEITVWDSGANGNGHGSSASQFLSSLVKRLPPPQEIAKMAGLELPARLGRVKPDEAGTQHDARA